MKIFVKIFRWVTGIIVSLLIIAVVAVYILLSDKVLTRVANDFADRCITVNSHIGNVHLELLKDYPISRLAITDIALGEGESALGILDTLYASLDLKKLRDGSLDIREISINGLRGNLEFYDGGGSNLDVFDFPSSDSDSEKESSFPKSFSIARASISGNSSFRYKDEVSGMDALLDGIDLNLSSSKGSYARPRRGTGMAGSRRRMTDSLPDFLSEKDFSKSDLSIQIDSSITRFVREWNPQGELKVHSGSLAAKAFPLKTSFAALDASLDGNVFDLHSLGVKSGSSQLVISGKLKDVHRLLSSTMSVVNVDLGIYAKRLNLNELLDAFNGRVVDGEAVEAVDTVQAETKLLVIPANLIADIDLNASLVNYSTFDIDSLSSKIAVRERTAQILDAKATSPMGNIMLDAFYSSRTKTDISSGLDLSLRDVTAERVIDLVPAVDDVLPMIKSLTGKLNFDLSVMTQLDSNMRVVTPSIDGVFSISGRNLRIDEPKNFSKFLRFLLFRKRDYSHLDELDVSGIVKDNELQVLPFVIQLDKYAVGLSGTQNFNQQFQYRVSMIKSPFLIRFGLKLYGDDFQKIRFRPIKSDYKRVAQVPDYTDDVEFERSNIIGMVRNPFRNSLALDVEKRRLVYKEKVEDTPLTYKEINDIEMMLIEMDIDADIEELSAEIDQFVATL